MIVGGSVVSLTDQIYFDALNRGLPDVVVAVDLGDGVGGSVYDVARGKTLLFVATSALAGCTSLVLLAG